MLRMKSFRMISASFLLVLAGCEPPQKAVKTEPAPPAQAPSIPTFPVSRDLTDTSGRKVKMQVVGKSVSEVYVTRDSDGSKFRIPFAKLSKEDQAFLSTYPDSPAPAGFFDREPTTKDEGPLVGKAAQIKNRKDALKKLQARNLEIYEILRLSTNQIEVRSLNSELERNGKEIFKLEDQINRLEQP